jgi:integrase
VLSFAEAQAKAREWFQKLARGDGRTGPYTINQALNDYVADYERRGGRDRSRLEWAIDANIRPALGGTLIASLTRQKIERWHLAVATTPARVRTGRDQEQRYFGGDMDDDALRRRRATANRVLTILRATLNLAAKNGRADDPEQWRRARPFRGVNTAKVRYLSDDETRRLVEGCDGEFRPLVTAALLTGARYGELAALTFADFNAEARTLYIARSKSGRARHTYLTDEAVGLFAGIVAGKSGAALIFTRKNGAPWRHSNQIFLMRDACRAGQISPAIGFHILRHCHASRLAMRGVPMGVIAAQLGHSNTRITEKHYAHLAPSYVGDTIRAAFGSLNIV